MPATQSRKCPAKRAAGATQAPRAHVQRDRGGDERDGLVLQGEKSRWPDRARQTHTRRYSWHSDPERKTGGAGETTQDYEVETP